MNRFTLALLFISISSYISEGQTNEKGRFPAGIVYGPKAAYQIHAPDNWILDNQSGLSMGLPCVLYLKGYKWSDSPVIMYAQISDSAFEKIDIFIDSAIRVFKKEDPQFYFKELKNGLVDGKKYVIMNYQGGPYNSYERVLYIQMEKAIGFIVFSAQNKNDFDNYADSIFEILNTFQYKPECIK